MKKENSLENRRADLIDKLSHIELSASLVKKLEALLGQTATPPMPGQISDDELNEMIENQRLNPQKGVSHTEFVRQAMQW